MPTISVIIPAYNSEQTIKETVESVLNQTFTDFELIVVDDSSQDGTLKIVSQIQDPRLQVFSYPHAGGAVSRNRGFSQSSGEFIAFLDSDDLWLPDKLEVQLKALQENPQAAVAYSWLDCVDESGNFVRQGSHRTENGDIFAKLYLVPFVESGSNPLIRRQALLDVGCFDESLTAGQDYDLYLRLAARYHFVAVPSTKVLYRIRSNSMTANFRRHEVTSLEVRERIFSQANKALSPFLKHQSIANFYKDFTFRVLDMPPNRQRGWTALWLILNAVRYDPGLAKTKVFKKVLFKIATVMLLPPEKAEAAIAKKKHRYDIGQLFEYMQREP
jgi:glycosyltransferase involved in cell wall biosynthesis